MKTFRSQVKKGSRPVADVGSTSAWGSMWVYENKVLASNNKGSGVYQLDTSYFQFSNANANIDIEYVGPAERSATNDGEHMPVIHLFIQCVMFKCFNLPSYASPVPCALLIPLRPVSPVALGRAQLSACKKSVYVSCRRKSQPCSHVRTMHAWKVQGKHRRTLLDVRCRHSRE